MFPWRTIMPSIVAHRLADSAGNTVWKIFALLAVQDPARIVICCRDLEVNCASTSNGCS